ncbi:hypothetical protein E0Z10_g9890 [Xylaria hypoxylon]|uniref:DUF1479 domain protein n=1 Tax=Xylaria hypoxylon TaxID=37992 RepID=A0A4Z0YJL4_9PEZI|nr:hypothetical protein E0Z10_g9890 [Xylaria hypoxylon]
MATMTSTQSQPQVKREGNISDSFASLSGGNRAPLPERFLELKKSLAAGHEDQIVASWKRLLAQLKQENKILAKEGSKVVPSLEFSNLEKDLTRLRSEIKMKGVAVIRGVIPENEARAYKDDIEEYGTSESVRGAVKTDERLALLKPRKFHLIITDSYICRSYGGSVERWEKNGYGLGGVYDKVFEGSWEEYDPWDASTRASAVMDNYNGLGASSMFRMFQGWLSMSNAKGFEGTLLVNPLLQLSTAYYLLRPFFRPVKESKDLSTEEYLAADNWVFAGSGMTSELQAFLQGATPGTGQELNAVLHPHLELDTSMVHMPEVKPGDFVVWHCDTIHAVDKIHNGQSDSSVLYIPICPVTEKNAKYLVRQRNAFLAGTPGPDFPGGEGESKHVNRPTVSYLQSHANSQGLRAFGFEKLVTVESDGPGALRVLKKANEILGF